MTDILFANRVVDTLRLPAEEFRQLISSGHPASSRPNGRREDRRRYQPPQGIVLEVEHPGGSRARLLVRPRNISRGGVGFLHGGFLHDRSPCRVYLWLSDGGVFRVAAHVAHCRHVSGKIHEVGLKFATSVDLSRLPLDIEAARSA